MPARNQNADGSWSDDIGIQVGGALVSASNPVPVAGGSTPSAANVASVPTSSRDSALYLSASGALTTSGATTTLTNFAALAEAGNTLFDAHSCTLVVSNPSGVGQTITSGSLSFSDTVGGVSSTITYSLPGTVSIAAGANQTFQIPLNSGVLKNASLSVTFGGTPTAGTLSALCILWNATNAISGDTASGNTDSGNPVKIGGLGSSTAPSAVTNGQRVNSWWSLDGRLGAFIASTNNVPTNAGGSPAAVAQGNSESINALGVSPSIYNGVSWDQQRANTDLSLLASAARTTATTCADQTNYNGRGVRIVLSVTVASGTGGLQVQIRGKDSISGNYYQLNTTPSAVTGTGTFVYDVYPTTLSAAANGITQVTQALLPRTWGINVAVGDASSYTYSVSGVTIL